MIAALIALLAVVNSPVNSVTYACDGSTAVYTVNFPYLSSSDLVVTSTPAAGGATTLTPGTDWSVNLTSTSSTASLTLNSPSTKCLVGSTLKITRAMALTQPTSFKQQNNYSPSVHEQAFDRAAMLAQQNSTLAVSGDLTGNLPVPRLAPSGVAAGTYGNANNVPVVTFDSKGRATSATMTAVTGVGVGTTYTAPFSGAVSRLPGDKFSDLFSVCDIEQPCPNGVDDTAALQTALNDAAATNTTVRLPPGVFRVSSTLLVTGNTAAGTGQTVSVRGSGGGAGSLKGTTILWVGADAVGTVLFKVNGVFRFSMSDLVLNGNGTAETLFYSTENSPTTYAGYGWQFNNVNFMKTRVNGRAFSIPDTTVNQARYIFTGCLFAPATQDANGILSPLGTVGFYTSNQNALDHIFIGCEFTQSDYGIYVEGGSVKVYGTDFTMHSVADLFFHFSGHSLISGSWTEQSRQFIVGANSGVAPLASVTVEDTHIASNPWAYWKHFESTRPQPTNDTTQWAAISWDRETAFNLIGSVLTDPYLGAVQGVVAPTTSSFPTILKLNGVTSPLNFNIIGSTSSTSLSSPTTQFLMLGAANAAPRGVFRKRYNNFGAVFGAAIVPDINSASVAEFNLNANATVTVNTSHAEAGDALTLIFNQTGAANFTTTFVNVNLLGGAFVPLVGLNVRSSIKLQFNGTAWDEVSRTKGT